jgi:hypothetical protein
MFIKSILVISSISNTQINNEKGIKYNWKTDLSKSTTELDEFMAVLPGDSLYKLDYPKFVSKEKGMEVFYEK